MAVTAPRGFSPPPWGRRSYDTYMGYERWRPMSSIYRFQENPCHGSDGRFPKHLQYQHTPFKLLDPSKRGHQLVVAFYLIDPGNPAFGLYLKSATSTRVLDQACYGRVFEHAISGGTHRENPGRRRDLTRVSMRQRAFDMRCLTEERQNF